MLSLLGLGAGPWAEGLGRGRGPVGGGQEMGSGVAPLTLVACSEMEGVGLMEAAAQA